MDKIWHHAVIRYLQKKRLTNKEIHPDMVSTLGDDAPALSTVKKWATEFKWGRESLEDDLRSGRPSTATTQENIARIHQMIMNGRRLTIVTWPMLSASLANEWRTFSTTNLACQKFRVMGVLAFNT